MPETVLIWLRRDLRLADNRALAATLERGERPVPLFILDEEVPHPPGGAERWWLHHSLRALRAALRERGSDLIVRRGPSAATLCTLARECGARRIYWNRRYEPEQAALERSVGEVLAAAGLHGEGHPGALLWEPGSLLTGTGAPYRVFTPFWRRAQTAPAPVPPTPAPDALPPLPKRPARGRVKALGLAPTIRWDGGLAARWTPGEAAAQAALARFCDERLVDYPAHRDRPDLVGTSHLSPHLHFGEVTPARVWHAVMAAVAAEGRLQGPAEAFLRQLAWREFAHHLLHFFPHTADAPLDGRFAAFPWRRRYGAELARWQRGETGIPIVDAGMRELWASGWMHNRVRMLTASLLTKNLLIPWQEGAAWFTDTLVDADLANNSFGWQWTAGCGADAAPYFRIFNPVSQGERFDPNGEYVARWLPELAKLAPRWRHQPWQAPAAERERAGLRLGGDYPEPMLDLAATRRRALAAWEQIRHRAV